MQNKLQELTVLLKQRQPALPALFPHLTTSSAPHPHAMLYNVPPTAWYPKPMNQNPIIPSQCQMSSTPNQVQNNPQLLNMTTNCPNINPFLASPVKRPRHVPSCQQLQQLENPLCPRPYNVRYKDHAVSSSNRDLAKAPHRRFSSRHPWLQHPTL